MNKATARVLLQLGSLGVVLLGVMAAFASHPATMEPWRMLSDVVQWPWDGRPTGFSLPTMQMNAVLGGVMVGWGVTLLLLARGPLAKDGREQVASAALVGLLAWFVVDGLGSWASGLYGNLVLNTLSLVAMAPPLWVLSRRPQRSD